jgi:dienelactone hydrolase
MLGVARRAMLGVALATAVNAPGAGASVSSRSSPPRIGMRTVTFVDHSRSTRVTEYHPQAESSRTLVTSIWHPADRHGHPVRSGRPFPVVLYSHGTGSDGQHLPADAPRWVQAGYVVVAPTYPLSTSLSCTRARTIGVGPKKANGSAAPCRRGQRVEMTGPDSIVDIPNEPGDAHFVLDQVLRLNRDRKSWMHGLIDSTRIGAAGHSQGAVTTVALTHSDNLRDSRVKASVVESGCAFNPESTGFFGSPHAPPLLLVHGDADMSVPYSCSEGEYPMAAAPKAFVTLHNTNHHFQLATNKYRDDWCRDPAGAIECRVSLDFLDAYLKHDRHALDRLRHDGNVPGIASLQIDTSG